MRFISFPKAPITDWFVKEINSSTMKRKINFFCGEKHTEWSKKWCTRIYVVFFFHYRANNKKEKLIQIKPKIIANEVHYGLFTIRMQFFGDSLWAWYVCWNWLQKFSCLRHFHLLKKFSPLIYFNFYFSHFKIRC